MKTSEKWHISRFQIYGIIGVIIFFIVTLWPHFYTSTQYANLVGEGEVANVFGLGGTVQKLEYASRSIPKAAILTKSGVVSFKGLPLWRIILFAPQYPKRVFPNGLLVNIYFGGPVNGCKKLNCLHEIDTINHYIGMQPLTVAAPVLTKVAPYLSMLFVVMLIIFIVTKKRLLALFALLPSVTPFVFLLVFSYWNHWLGYNLSNYAPFTVHSFTPILFGIGKVAQFSTHNRPAYGFTLLMIASILMTLSYISKVRYLKRRENDQ